MAEQPALGFAGLLRQLRAGAKLTQEELAEAAGLSPRSVSDLERGVNRTARKDTAELLAGALGLAGPVRALFVAAARGRAPADEVLSALRGETVAPADWGPGRQALELSPARFEFDTNRLPTARPRSSAASAFAAASAPCSSGPAAARAPSR